MAKRFDDDALLEAAGPADDLLEAGDMAGAATWHRILHTMDRLQATKRYDGEAVH